MAFVEGKRSPVQVLRQASGEVASPACFFQLHLKPESGPSSRFAFSADLTIHEGHELLCESPGPLRAVQSELKLIPGVIKLSKERLTNPWTKCMG